MTSALPGEGKTVLAANLALHIAQMGKRALLVDAQSYRPELSKSMEYAIAAASSTISRDARAT
ncbi:hypothetical protein WHT83_24295 (plasmid) [Aminobacter sp. P9b]|uniref:nucleotide-binding protein n=1 Tax=Aminobacter sp. P9b TaxID=3133697 RepID=UPI003251521C